MAKNDTVDEYVVVMEETSKVALKLKAFCAAVTAMSDELPKIRAEIVRAQSFLSKSLADSREANEEAEAAKQAAHAHLESTHDGHRNLVDSITKERIEMQELRATIERERREVQETRRLLDEQLRQAQSKVRGLTQLEAAGKK